MEHAFPLFFAGIVGFTHAFEADHLVAVGNIVSRRDRSILAVKDGIFWGLGHTSTIFLIGLLFIIAQVQLSESFFGYSEAFVGLMLVGLGLFRIGKLRKKDTRTETLEPSENHHLAYGVGLIHGLAGSGALVLLVMTEIPGKINSLIYLLIFGLGSVFGMFIAAGIFSLPFSKKLTEQRSVQLTLVVASALLCITYGAWMIFSHLAGYK